MKWAPIALNELIPKIIACLHPLLTKPDRQLMHIEFQSPVLTRKAAILPIINPDGAIAQLRAQALQQLKTDPVFYDSLVKAGIEHSKDHSQHYDAFSVRP